MHMAGRDGLVQLVQFDVDPARHVDRELERLHGLGLDLEAVLGRGVHMQLVGGVAVDANDDLLLDRRLQLLVVGVTLPPLMSTSMTSRVGGAWSFDMSDGPTVDG